MVAILNIKKKIEIGIFLAHLILGKDIKVSNFNWKLKTTTTTTNKQKTNKLYLISKNVCYLPLANEHNKI